MENNLKNRDKINAYNREYYHKNKEKIKAIKKKYCNKNKEKIKISKKKYNDKHRDRINAYYRESYRKNKEKRRAYSREYYHKNEEKRRAYYHKNRDKRLERARRYREKKPWMSHYKAACSRCNNPKRDNYKYYGGRGIKMLMTSDDFKFLWFRDQAYLLKKPSIDRIENNEHYELDNCHFIEHGENSKKEKIMRINK